ncbi:hypothetical protein SteCoe_13654 [Stentor coeruleus]|uniref:SBF1/SBF2 domain-containing protein n=1 Tax=Stentor coeruleus TaxID=5963 RepID=A0A1R2C7Y0_9CILI|nr:hypothetical protein SteCoe_13654 [Stentor coeruleus]
MSYFDLWDRFDEVCAFWTENKRTLEDLSVFIKEKAELDRYYSKGLEKISKLPLFDRAFGTVSPIFDILKKFYSSSTETLFNHSSYLLDEIYVKLKKIITSHDLTIQDLKLLGKKSILDREKFIKKHLKARDKYWQACTDSEQSNKYHTKAAQQEEILQKSYMSAINKLNSFNIQFKDNMKRILNTYQNQNLEKMQTMRQVMQAFVAGEASNIYSMKMYIDNLPIAIDVFNPDVDQRMFIDLVFTGAQIEDQSFVSSAQSLSQPHFISHASIKRDQDLINIINKCWNGEALTNEDKEHFSERINKDNGKKKLIILLNEKRKNGEFTIHKDTFKDLGEIFSMALDTFTGIEHLNMAKQCIILSQTFFMVKENLQEGTSEKIYLQTLIIGHDLWKKEDYWENMVKNAVEDALNSLNEFGDEYDKQNKDTKRNSVIISAIVSYVHMMISFNVDKERVVLVLMKVKDRYKITDLDVSDLIGLVS